MLCLLCSAACVAASSHAEHSKHNIVYVMTDDQDVELGGLTPMPKTRRLLGEGGAVGEAMYVATPICCPSRTETLSGRLYHNVLSDDLGGCMHVNHTHYIFDHSSSLFPALQSAGYMTGGFGKIINGQRNVFNPERPRLVGWDWLSIPLDEGDYFCAEYFEKRPNGTFWKSSLGSAAEVVDKWYQTSQIGNRSLEFIAAAVALHRPFVAYLGPHAPHYSADAPPWLRGEFMDLKAPRTPAWNTSEGQVNKTMHVAQNPPLTSEMVEYIDVHFRDRWRAIAGVDDMIGLIIEQLERWGALNSTYMLLTSDHGYKLGEWRLGCSKEHPYETDVHIPFFMRGPGIVPGTRIAALTSNIDIAPTLIEIAGLPANPEHDGNSLLPLLTAPASEVAVLERGWRTSQIIEYLSVGTYYNDHAKLWLSGPSATPGTPVRYGAGPWTNNPSFTKSDCPASEGTTAGEVGKGSCWFVDSQASNNWLALRVRNSTHNFVYIESYGYRALTATAPVQGGASHAKGIFACLNGDFCQSELYGYGAITADYPTYPVMARERWNVDNLFAATPTHIQVALHAELKHAYCSTRRLAVDRMECGSSTSRTSNF
eukprot:CAMPEP_0119331290 /NCGR_PEP_ID=MMETSP1333-20130426/80277_1 /TAXON_ID=418940 /ORGANISM="Scyphosphaera apsteinii, Strain RCC1455" /LENGTH=595 /DNA_ID=CAMNT_0007340855 /DNA_START=21 /DNA_END=1808 /DNA_ORIENTATION=-